MLGISDIEGLASGGKTYGQGALGLFIGLAQLQDQAKLASVLSMHDLTYETITYTWQALHVHVCDKARL